MYKEIKPDGAFAKYINAFWYSENLTSAEYFQKILPDGCSDIIIPMSGEKTDPVFVGYMTKITNAGIKPGEKMFGLRFNPGHSYAVIGDSMSQFTDRATELAAVKKIDFSNLQNDFRENGKINFTMLNLILNKIIKPPAKESRIFHALTLIRKDPSFIKIEELADSLSISRRFLEKEFKKYIGLTPKKYMQIERINRAVKMPGRKLPDMALEHGYYDQAHFIKEFKEFTGETPSKFFS
jgi:AraC-like DNA-binding protein